MTRFSGRRLGRRAMSVGALLGLLATTLAAAPVSAAPTITREINTHFSRSQHYDANPACFGAPGVTEIQEGNGHLIIIDGGTWLNVTSYETHWITVVPDDPSLATTTRQVTAVIHFRAQADGDVVFHQSFHDFGVEPWDPDAKIQFRATFVTRNGEVMVDRSFSHDEPPAGC